MYAAEAEKADEASCSGAWNWHRQRASPARNLFRPVRTIKWRELTDIQHLADGAMCSCYTAQLGGCTVVIKKPSPSSRETSQEIERQLEIEQAYLSQLDHPNIIQLIGAGRRGLRHHFEPFLVLEYLQGGTLGRLIKERGRGGGEIEETGVHHRRRAAFELPHYLSVDKNYIPWAQAMGWARDMALALRYLHEEASNSHMYVCRDLKPDNIGFTADGTLKIFDFGLARKITRRPEKNPLYTMTSRTGTVRYMAPEAFLGFMYNEKVDVYAWSHVVAEMLYLEVAYFGMTVDEFRVKVALGSERPHVERRWPKMLQRLLRRCWQTRPVDRPSFDEILGGGVLEEVAGPNSHSFLNFFGHGHRTPKVNTIIPPPELGKVAGPKAVEKAAALAAAAEAAAGGPILGVRTGASILEKTGGISHSHEGASVRGHVWDTWEVGGEIVASGRPVAAAVAGKVAAAELRNGEDVHDAVGAQRFIQVGPFRLPFCFFGHNPLGHHRHGNHHNHNRRRRASSRSKNFEGKEEEGDGRGVGQREGKGGVPARTGGASGAQRNRDGNGGKLDILEMMSTRRPTDPEDERIRAQAC